MTWGHKHKPQGQQQGQAQGQAAGQPTGPMSASSPEEAEAIKRAHWQAHSPASVTMCSPGRDAQPYSGSVTPSDAMQKKALRQLATSYDSDDISVGSAGGLPAARCGAGPGAGDGHPPKRQAHRQYALCLMLRFFVGTDLRHSSGHSGHKRNALRPCPSDPSACCCGVDRDDEVPGAAAVMGADLAGLTAGGVAGGTAGFGYADLGTNGITLVADLAEQNMAQVCADHPPILQRVAHNLIDRGQHWQRAALWAAQKSSAI